MEVKGSQSRGSERVYIPGWKKSFVAWSVTQAPVGQDHGGMIALPPAVERTYVAISRSRTACVLCGTSCRSTLHFRVAGEGKSCDVVHTPTSRVSD